MVFTNIKEIKIIYILVIILKIINKIGAVTIWSIALVYILDKFNKMAI
ncbi:hypothetical protein ACE5D9_07320 [Rickettsia sp. 2024-CO-Wats]